MKISQLIKKLEAIQNKRGNLHVMFTDPNSDGGPFSVNICRFEEVESDDCYPEDFEMPKGFKFVHLEN